MKLCLILGGNEEGGLENHFFELANTIKNYLPKNDVHEIAVVASECYRNRLTSDVIFHAIDLEKSRRNPFVIYQIIRFLKKYSPDIIHTHANKASAIINIAHPFLNCKLVATIHSQKKNSSMYEKFDHVIGVSRSVISNVRNPHKNVIYNGVPDSFINNRFNEITRKELGINNALPILVSIGRLVKVKALDTLLRSIQNIPCNLLIIGEGPEQKYLQQQVQQQKIQNVHFLGFKQNVKGYLELADLCVVSSYREGFSYVVAESLFMDTAVVSTDVPVANEILPKSCIAEIGNAKSLAQVINHALKNNEDYEPYFAFAKLHFTVEAMNTKIALIYHQLLSYDDKTDENSERKPL